MNLLSGKQAQIIEDFCKKHKFDVATRVTLYVSIIALLYLRDKARRENISIDDITAKMIADDMLSLKSL